MQWIVKQSNDPHKSAVEKKLEQKLGFNRIRTCASQILFGCYYRLSYKATLSGRQICERFFLPWRNLTTICDEIHLAPLNNS